MICLARQFLYQVAMDDHTLIGITVNFLYREPLSQIVLSVFLQTGGFSNQHSLCCMSSLNDLETTSSSVQLMISYMVVLFSTFAHLLIRLPHTDHVLSTNALENTLKLHTKFSCVCIQLPRK